MNLLLVNYEYPPIGGGAANATQHIGRALTALGHRVHVLTSGLQGTGGTCTEEEMVIHRLEVGRRQPDRARQWEMLRFLQQSRRAASALHRTQAFAGCVAFFTIPSGPAALELWRQQRVPYVVSLRGGDVPGHVPGLGLKHTLTRPLRRRVLRHAAAIVANSEGLARTSRGADPFPVRVVTNGVDCATFRPASSRRKAPGTPWRVLFVGRVHPEKNLDVLFRQVARLPESVRGQLELQVVGDGAARPGLTELARELGLTPRLRWLGWQGKSELPHLYREADVLINPSQYEGMPNVVLEAMASGLPVFASDVPGNRSVVLANQTGVLFSLDHPDELGAALLRLATDPSWAEALGQAGRRRVEQEFSWTRAAQSYLELFTPDRPTSGPS